MRWILRLRIRSDIAIPDASSPLEAELVEDEFTMLWLHQTNSRGKRMGLRGLLSAVLTLGWRITRASPEEQALLDAHGFGSRRVQSSKRPAVKRDATARRLRR